MPEQIPLDVADQALMGQIARFAERRAENGVYMAQMVSKSTGGPVLLIVALGDQALALDQIIMRAQAPPSAQIEVVSDLNKIDGKF